MSQRRKVSWSNLPGELLDSIAHRLETRRDIFNVRAVCKEWRNSVSLTLLSGKNILSAVLPHKLSTPNPPLLRGGAAERTDGYFEDDDYPFKNKNKVFIVVGSIFLIKPAFDLKLPPWVVTVEELKPGKLKLQKPLCRSAAGKLPRYIDFPKILDLSRFEVEEIGRVYSLRYKVKPFHLFEEQHKVLMLGGEISAKIEDYAAAVLYDSGVLAVINLKNEVVKEASFNSRRKFDDIVMYKGMIHSIDRRGRLYSMEYTHSNSQLKMTVVVEETLYSALERKSRLVESYGELYLVRKCMVSRASLERKTMGVRVYKLNHETNAWDELDSIGDDRILFLTPDCGFFVKVSDFPGWKGNHIIVHSTETTDCFPSHGSAVSYKHSRSWEFEEELFIIEEPSKKTGLEVCDFEKCIFCPVEFYREYSAVFWPPPEWVAPNRCSFDRYRRY